MILDFVSEKKLTLKTVSGEYTLIPRRVAIRDAREYQAEMDRVAERYKNGDIDDVEYSVSVLQMIADGMSREEIESLAVSELPAVINAVKDLRDSPAEKKTE